MGLEIVKEDVVMIRTPDGSGKVELVKIPQARPKPRGQTHRRRARPLAFVVDDLIARVDKLRSKCMNTVGSVQDYMASIGSAANADQRKLSVELAERIGSARAR